MPNPDSKIAPILLAAKRLPLHALVRRHGVDVSLQLRLEMISQSDRQRAQCQRWVGGGRGRKDRQVACVEIGVAQELEIGIHDTIAAIAQP